MPTSKASDTGSVVQSLPPQSTISHSAKGNEKIPYIYIYIYTAILCKCFHHTSKPGHVVIVKRIQHYSKYMSCSLMFRKPCSTKLEIGGFSKQLGTGDSMFRADIRPAT